MTLAGKVVLNPNSTNVTSIFMNGFQNNLAQLFSLTHYQMTKNFIVPNSNKLLTTFYSAFRNCYKQFLFSHKVFYSYISIVHQNTVLCGNGLMGRCAIWFHSGKSKVKVTMAICVFPGQTSSLQANALTMDKSNFVVSSTGRRPASLCHGLLSVVRPSVRPSVR